MQTTQRSEYEKLLLQEIEDLPASEVKKILRIVHFLKKEFIQATRHEHEDDRQFWDSFGSWQDDRPAQDIVKEIYEARKSSHRDIQL